MTKDEEQQLYDSPIRVPRAEWGTLYEKDYADIDKEMQELLQRFGPLDQTMWQRMRDRLIREHRIMETYLNAGADPKGRAFKEAAAATNISRAEVLRVLRVRWGRDWPYNKKERARLEELVQEEAREGGND
jgi:hypothetical protein